MLVHIDSKSCIKTTLSHIKLLCRETAAIICSRIINNLIKLQQIHILTIYLILNLESKCYFHLIHSIKFKWVIKIE